MAKDLKLDTTTHDVVIVDGDFVFVEGSEEVAQKVKIHLLTLSAEWILDVGIGLRTFDKIFNVGTPEEEKRLIIKTEILGVDGVLNILSFDFEIDYINHSLAISFEATTDYGNIVIEVKT